VRVVPVLVVLLLSFLPSLPSSARDSGRGRFVVEEATLRADELRAIEER
jgi:hypothetical protein